MKEIQEGALALGLRIEEGFLYKMMDSTDKMVPYYTSMHLDRRNGLPMEIESIIGEPLRQGQQQGVAMPEMQKLYRELLEVERSNRDAE